MQQLLKTHPDSGLVQDARFRLAEMAREDGDLKQAAGLYEEVLASGPVPFADSVLYKLAWTQQDLEQNSILIGITPQGEVYYGGRSIGIGGVRAVVARLLQHEEMPVIIQADKSTPTETTVKVLDEAKLGGAGQVFVSTVSDS